jgi:hypothetical protein
LNETWKEGYKWSKDEEEDVSNCWMILGKREDTGNLKRKRWIAL